VKQFLKRIFKWVAILVGLMVLLLIGSIIFENWKSSINEEIAFECEIEELEGASFKIILQSSPKSRDKQKYWNNGLILLNNTSSTNEDKHYSYLGYLNITKVDLDFLYLRNHMEDTEYKINRESFATSMKLIGSKKTRLTASICEEKEPSVFKESAQKSQAGLEDVNKI
jgi:hypothetical protein